MPQGQQTCPKSSAGARGVGLCSGSYLSLEGKVFFFMLKVQYKLILSHPFTVRDKFPTETSSKIYVTVMYAMFPSGPHGPSLTVTAGQLPQD